MANDTRRVRNRVLEMARKDELKGDWKSALRRYRRLTGLDADEPSLHIKLGEVCLRLEHEADAADAFFTAGSLFTRKAFDEKAAALYKRALVAAPERRDVRDALIQAYERLGRTKDAIVILEQASEHMERHGKPSEALALRRKVAELDPLEVDPRLRLARDLEAAGELEQALDEYVSCTVELLRQGAFERARGVFATLRALAPAADGDSSGDGDSSEAVDRLVDRAEAWRAHFRALGSLYRRVALLHHRERAPS